MTQVTMRRHRRRCCSQGGSFFFLSNASCCSVHAPACLFTCVVFTALCTACCPHTALIALHVFVLANHSYACRKDSVRTNICLSAWMASKCLPAKTLCGTCALVPACSSVYVHIHPHPHNHCHSRSHLKVTLTPPSTLCTLFDWFAPSSLATSLTSSTWLFS